MAKAEYPYPTGIILNQDLCRRVNSVVGFQDDKTPFSALYIEPNRAFVSGVIYRCELEELYYTYTSAERRVVKNVYGALLNDLYIQAKRRLERNLPIDPQEISPTLGLVRKLSPTELRRSRRISWNGALFIHHSIYGLT